MLDGVRVIEMGLWVAGPAAAGILADWGADVVKIEAPTGDPMRAFFQLATGYAGVWYGVDPFDQPGVELGKTLTFAAMGRPGYTAEPQETPADEA